MHKPLSEQWFSPFRHTGKGAMCRGNIEDKMKNKNQLTEEEISLFCLQTAYLLRAGVPLYALFSDGMSDMKNKKLQRAFALVGESIEKQNTLEKSLRNAGCFPEYACSMVALGEASGRLDEVLLALSGHYDKEKRIRAGVKQAVMYPMVLFFIMSLVVSLLVFRILPMFGRIFSQLGGTVSSAAQAMLDFGKGAGFFAFGIIIAVFFAVISIILYSKTEKGRLELEKIAVKLPFIRDIASKSLAVRFSSAMSLALSSGSCLDEAVEMSAEIMGNKTVGEKLNSLRADLANGISFGEFLEKTEAFPLMFTRMAAVGMQTGNLDEAMKKLSGIYADELEGSITAFINAVEPALVGIIALIVGMILVSVLLPLTGAMAAIG